MNFRRVEVPHVCVAFWYIDLEMTETILKFYEVSLRIYSKIYHTEHFKFFLKFVLHEMQRIFIYVNKT